MTLVALGKVVAAGACWGLAAVIARTAFDRGVSPIRMAEARVFVALVLLAALLAWRRRDLLRFPRGALPVILGFGLSVALVNAAYYVAIDRLAVGVAISIQYTAPVLLLGLAALAGRRARRAGAGRAGAGLGGGAGRIGWVAAVLTLAGAVLVSRAVEGLDVLDAVGILAAVASSVTFASYLLTAEAAGRRGLHPGTVLVWGFVVAILFWAIAAPWWSWPVARLADARVALAVVGVGAVGTLLPFFLAVSALRVLAPATAGVAATVEPPFAAGFAWIFLDERLAAVQVVGGLLVIAGVALAQRMPTVSPGAVAMEVAP